MSYKPRTYWLLLKIYIKLIDVMSVNSLVVKVTVGCKQAEGGPFLKAVMVLHSVKVTEVVML